MAEAKQMPDMVESLLIPNDCQTDIRNLRGVVPRRADKIPRPQSGFLTRIPPVYGCDMLAAHSISDASKVRKGHYICYDLTFCRKAQLPSARIQKTIHGTLLSFSAVALQSAIHQRS